MKELRDLAEYLTGIRWTNFSEETVVAAKLVLADTLAAIVFGNQSQEIGEMADRIRKRESGSFDIFGTRWQTGAYSAAFLNGFGSVATEMDEGNQWSKGHPAAHVVPALLTSAQAMDNCSGQRLLQAVIAGYEACSRFGRATTLRPEAHAHGTWGVMGAAASVALLNGADAEQWVQAVMVSSHLALPTMWNSALEGALVRNVYAGHAAEIGLRAWDFVQSGIGAPKQSVEYVFGSVLGQRFNPADLHEGLGDVWDIQRNYFKPYAFCRYAHAPIDAFSRILERHAVTLEKIARIEVKTYARAATLNNQQPHNVLAAKFSIPYALAVRFFTGKADVRSFGEELLFHEGIRQLMKKIEVVPSAELEKDYPSIMPAVVTLTTTDGEVYEERCDMARGGLTDPFTVDELKAKFMDLTAAAYAPDTQAQLWELIWTLEQQPSLAPLFDALRSIHRV